MTGARLSSVVLVAAVLVVCTDRSASAARDRPNVVLISIDCLNASMFEEAIRNGEMPQLAALADRSTVFSRAYAQAPWTTPAHMTMLTGLLPHQHGRNLPWGLMLKFNATYDREPEHPTLATLLAAAGYETAAFVGGGSVSGQFGFARGFSVYQEPTRQNDLGIANRVTACREWLDRRSPRPFFLFFHTYELHPPTFFKSLSAARAHVDQQLGVLLEALDSRGLLGSSLLFLTGDHGSHIEEVPGRCSTHGAGHYEDNIHVPLLMKTPGEKLRGRCEAIVRQVDIYPTVTAALRLSRRDYHGPGVSLLDVLAGKRLPDHSFSAADGRCAVRFAVVTDRHKYIYTPRSPLQMLYRASKLFFDDRCPAACAEVPAEELFDLRADPGETTNLLLSGASEETLADAARLRALLEADLALPPRYRVRVVPATLAPPLLDETVRGNLVALGYLDDSGGGSELTRVFASTDFDGDGRADRTIFRAGAWEVLRAAGADPPTLSQSWGVAGDLPVPGDYGGSKAADFAIWRPSTGGWYVLFSDGSGELRTTWGVEGDVPVPGNYGGDARVDFAVWRPGSGVWYVTLAEGTELPPVTWGVPGDVPVPADYDGDGTTDIAVYSPPTGTWRIRTSTGGTWSIVWGGNDDIPVPGRYNTGSKDVIAVFRPATGQWLVWSLAKDLMPAVVFGTSGDIPLPAQMEGDRRTDFVLWRPTSATWLVRSAEGKVYSTEWGTAGDIPVAR